MAQNCNDLCKIQGLNPQDIYKSLTNLVRNLGRDDISTVEALMIDLTGDSDAGRMLNRLMYWWSKTENAEGWVYKDYQDWWAEMRIKASRLPRTKGALERVGVQIKVKKANGNPTRHYRLDVKTFLQLVARTLNLSRKKLMALLQKPIAAIPKMEIVNGQKTITTDSNTPSTDVVVNNALIQTRKIKGLKDESALQLIQQYGTDAVLRLAPRFQTGNWKNPAGAFRQALRENWQFEPVEAQQSYMPAQPENTEPRFEETGAQADTAPIPPSPLPPADAPDAFRRMIDQVKAQMGRQGDDLAGVELVRSEGSAWYVRGIGYAAILLCDQRLRMVMAKQADIATGGQVTQVELAEAEVRA